MNELVLLVDEYELILKNEFLNAVDETQKRTEQLIFENYPIDSDLLPIENGLDQFVLDELTHQLFQGFEQELAALQDKSAIPIILLLSIPNFKPNIFKTNFIKSEIKLISAESKKTFQIAGNSKKRILESIGLTQNQIRSLSTYRQALEKITRQEHPPTTIDPKIIRYLSASQRAVLRKALLDGIDPGYIDALVYKQRKALLMQRAKTLAISLASKIAHNTQQAVLETAINLQLVKPQQYKRFWVTAHDEKVRHIHNTTAAMNAEGVDCNQPFDTPLGQVMNPPLEINCRCHVEIVEA